MQMINVLKRLAELDAQNPNIVKESQQVDECGMMGSMPSAPHTPASINMTAGSGPELSSMLRDIMSLAGLQGSQTGGHDDVEILTTEPEVQQEPGNATDAMRSVIDKLNPDTDGDGDGDAEPEDSDEGTLGTMAGAGLGAMLGGPLGAAAGGVAGDALTGEDDKKEEDYDNTPADPTDTNEFDSEEYAHHENPPGAAKGRGNHNNPRANTMEEIQQNLFAEYQKFISEN